MEAETKEVCGNCKRFYQHYVKRSRSYFPISMGHCGDPRIRDKRTDTPACHRYLKKQGDR